MENCEDATPSPMDKRQHESLSSGKNRFLLLGNNIYEHRDNTILKKISTMQRLKKIKEKDLFVDEV